MKIISGKYKGQSLKGFNIDGTRPTMNRVKESLFAMIQNKIKGSSVLDLFSGSGALGIEAISNGALSCTFVDNNHIAIKILKENLKKLKISENYKIIHSDYKEALNILKNEKFDLILLDPPYHKDYIDYILNKIIEYDMLTDNGYIICEFENNNINHNKLNIYKERNYGTKKIVIYNKRI